MLRVTGGGQSILSNNTLPLGGPDLDYPSDMAFLPDGDIAVTDQGFTFGRPAVVEVNKSTGARTLISGRGRGAGPALQIPASIVVEASGDILITDVSAITGNPQLLRIDPATGNG